MGFLRSMAIYIIRCTGSRSLWQCCLPLVVLAGVMLCAAPSASASDLNDKLLNRPYADMRRWNLGFGVGLNTFDLNFLHNDFITEDGHNWFVEQPSFSPGFSVYGLFNLRLNDYFSVRATPGMMFGNRLLNMTDVAAGTQERQDIKSAYIVLPVDVKFAGKRLRNARPYLVAGIMPAFDVLRKRPDFVKMKSSDFMVSVGFGCDFYLPYFKLIPELKFCFGLSDVLAHDRPDLEEDPYRLGVSNSLKKATTSMVVLSFYFE